MIDQARMKEIELRLADASLGYGRIGHTEYAQDVRLLLKEVEALQDQNLELLTRPKEQT